MLAQNFKTAVELGINEVVYNAACKVLVRLETGDLVHHNLDMPMVPNGFNMEYIHQSGDCGTVSCIAGWMAIEMGVSPFIFEAGLDFTGSAAALEDLFYPPSLLSYIEITVEEAAIALRDYLTTGKADWSHVPDYLCGK